jgi:uncharacterized alpha-E superfamily protein
MTASLLLARYAEGLFWMARYLERSENLARLVDVTQTFEAPGREAEAWAALVAINSDERSYRERYGEPDPDRVKRFYLLDRGNETGIPASIEAARLNARTLRPLISTEMWMQLNVFHRDVLAIAPDELEGDRLSRLCRRLQEGVQAHTGVTEGTFFRDQGWVFYSLGRLIERADQTTRLLDIKYHVLVPQYGEERRVAELTQWGAVLRGAAGYHAFRRVAAATFQPADVVGFLLNDSSFPRSVALCVDQIEWHLGQLRSRYGLRGSAAALERIDDVRAALSTPVAQLLPDGLHGFLDQLQLQLISLTREIGTAFFRDWRPLAVTTPPSQGQSQSQSQSGGGNQSQSQSQGSFVR